jgi:methylthioribose-1-phosphate isomerase
LLFLSGLFIVRKNLSGREFLSAINTQTADTIRPIIWADNHLRLLDQRQLPDRIIYLDVTTADDVAAAISSMVVRGAPAIGITAAYGVVLVARAAFRTDPTQWQKLMHAGLEKLAQSRPTAINLHWAIQRMQALASQIEGEPEPRLLAEAHTILAQDIAANRHMGELGATLIRDARQVLTHCNTGSLATGGYGTALGVIRSAWRAGTLEMVYASETRPWLQGARLTAWELLQDNIPITLIADSTANYLLSKGEVSWVIVGADRIVANGDVANKIGTYSLAVAARYHGVRMMVVAPTITFDLEIKTGSDVPIEDRGADEIIKFAGTNIAPDVKAWNPVFDITPASLIDVIVTEKGVIHNPDEQKIAAIFLTENPA